MRWLVEVSSIGKTDLQKFCVEAESWQRALQAARAQRGEAGPMSGFSIELLDEGYRAVDPLARVRFVVKRAPDDMPVTAPLAKESKVGVAPSPTSTASKAAFPAASAAVPAPATLALVGSALPGLPPVKVLSTREQDPTDASPLTYREYAFAVPAGTSEDIAVAVLHGQLKLIDAHLTRAKMGKLVNLAVFDVEFTGKPPSPPIATLSWKDWKGEPIIGYPRRGAVLKQVNAPSDPPASASVPTAAPAPPVVAPSSLSSSDGSAAPAPSGKDASAQTAAAPPAAKPAAPQVPAKVPTAPGAAVQDAFPVSLSSLPPPIPLSATAPLIPPTGTPPNEHPASVPPPAAPPPPAAASQGGIPVPVVGPAAVLNATSPAPGPEPAQAGSEPLPLLRRSAPDGMVRTPSGRFVRGRTTGDELITALFESMHDLHFLRDALDGGQFCLALATEVLPARAALIHFFDIEKREWVIACTRGKDTPRLLTLRTPESDELLRAATRKRRAIVTASPGAATAQRYQSLGGSHSMIIAPIMQAGRALGAIEIINPLDGMPFTEDEGNAMTYIGEQYAEYLGSRGIVLDHQRIQNSAAPR